MSTCLLRCARWIAGGVVIFLVVTACSSSHPTTPQRSLPPTTSSPAPQVPMSLGLYKADNTANYRFPARYMYALQYYGWAEGFQSAEARVAWRKGHTVFAELQTCGDPCDKKTVPVQDITAGLFDSYLTSFAEAVKAFRHPVLMTFDHEMNGDWYSWGHGKVKPSAWVAAWQYVTTHISAIAPNVRWVWTPNIEEGATKFDQYWPGNGYANPHVDIVGLDGYFMQGSTWENTFAQSVADIKALAGNRPFMVTETGVDSRNSNPITQIGDLVEGARSAGATALMYFDSDEHGQWSLTPAERSALISRLA